MSVKVKPGMKVRKINVVSKSGEERKEQRESYSLWPAPWVPRVDIYEQGEEMVVEVELPGVDDKDVTIIVHANRIDLKGKKKEAEEAKNGRYIRLEREYGEFSRYIPLPRLVFPDHSSAWLEDGVLSIRLKKYHRK